MALVMVTTSIRPHDAWLAGHGNELVRLLTVGAGCWPRALGHSGTFVLACSIVAVSSWVPSVQQRKQWSRLEGGIPIPDEHRHGGTGAAVTAKRCRSFCQLASCDPVHEVRYGAPTGSLQDRRGASKLLAPGGYLTCGRGRPRFDSRVVYLMPTPLRPLAAAQRQQQRESPGTVHHRNHKSNPRRISAAQFAAGVVPL